MSNPKFNRILLPLSWVIFTAAVLSTCTAETKRESNLQNTLPNPIEVELSTDKEVYKLGEPIVVTVTLRNRGSQPVWLSRFIGIARWPGAFEIEIFDAEGNQLRGDIPIVHGELTPPEKQDLFEYIRKRNSIFMPGDFFGFTRSLKDCGFNISTTGRYKIQALYGDVDLRQFVDPKRFEEAQKKAVLAIWSGVVRSRPAWIRVEP